MFLTDLGCVNTLFTQCVYTPGVCKHTPEPCFTPRCEITDLKKNSVGCWVDLKQTNNKQTVCKQPLFANSYQLEMLNKQTNKQTSKFLCALRACTHILCVATPDPRVVNPSPEPYLGKSVYRQATFAYRPGIHKERKVTPTLRVVFRIPRHAGAGTKTSPHNPDGLGRGLHQIKSDRDMASASYFKQVEDQEDAFDEELVRRRTIETATPYLGAHRGLEFQILAFEALEFRRRNFFA